jgi:hypothetical protein
MGETTLTSVPLRQWVTGAVPTTAGSFTTTPLPAPLYHDVPSVPETVLGPPCPRQGCTPTARSTTGKPLSTYYRRTRLCVRCLGRLKHQLPASLAATTGEDDGLTLR